MDSYRSLEAQKLILPVTPRHLLVVTVLSKSPFFSWNLVLQEQQQIKVKLSNSASPAR